MTLMDTGGDTAAQGQTDSDPVNNEPAAGTNQATTEPQEPADPSPPGDPEWMLSDKLPGEGSAPEWFKKDKYGTVEEQAKAYKELESRFGGFTGAPKDGDYTVTLSDELQELGIEIAPDDPLYADAVEFAKGTNMNQEGFDKMMNLYAMSRVAESKAAEEFRQDELKALGDNAQARIDNILNWGKANLPDDMLQGFTEMAVSANAVKAMEKLVSLTRNAPIDPNNAAPKQGVSTEELRKMQFETDEHGNRKLSTDPEFKKRFQKLANEHWGTEDHRVIIGS